MATARLDTTPRVVAPGQVAPSPSSRSVWPAGQARAVVSLPAARARRDAAAVAIWGFVAVGIALRWRDLGSHVLTLDESFTAMTARGSLSSIVSTLRVADVHPPLDYLLRAPLARAGVSDAVLRMPSAVFSSAALVVFAWWLRRRGVLGVLAVAVMALNGFQLLYGREARMYALLELLGVLAAVVTHAWLVYPRPRLTIAMSALVLVAVFDHVSGLLLAAGLLTAAAWRGDRAAWQWRIMVVLPVALWAVVWGPSFVHQVANDHTTPPRTSVSSITEALTGQVTTVRGAAVIVFVLVVAGWVVLRRIDRGLARVTTACAAVPFVVAVCIGLVTPVLIPRFVTIVSWAPPLLLAAILVEVGRRQVLVSAVIAVAVAAMVLTTTSEVLTEAYPVDRAMERLDRVLGPGDRVAISPAWLSPILAWSVGVHGRGEAVEVEPRGFDEAYVLELDGTRRGRTWILEAIGAPVGVHGPRCSPTWTDGVSRVRCVLR